MSGGFWSLSLEKCIKDSQVSEIRDFCVVVYRVLVWNTVWKFLKSKVFGN